MVRSVGVMPDGNRIISGGTDGTLRLWDIETGQTLAVVGGHLGHVFSLVALPDGRSVVSGDFDRQVKVWDLSASTSFVAKVGASMHPAEIRAMAIFPGTGRIAVGYMGNEECTEIRVWDVAQGGIPAGEGAKPTEVPPLWSVPGHDDTVVSLGVLGENGLVSSGFDRTVRVWSQSSCIEASDKEASLVIDSGENIAMAVMAWEDGRGLAYGCDDGSLHVWDLKRRREALSHPHRHPDGVKALDISKDGSLLCSAGADHALRLLRMDSASGVAP
ncbi:hypothetical protein NSK_002426 [Nannochloropsis salina CCMP1776]|uniref:Uncharacterized protein n=1 Tax=Nannochloropsis salina CCMP1776 TaxID=1027361 RepID=A0A4D9DC66_9STRA|nr:hypothetical protein NSK_002426 [Nannochloropsis salina CCMP1776]|eukprot:TFJ86218.1 hypothetical protein NSK_002426 [Nannochloropsis salina CCMP1776]